MFAGEWTTIAGASYFRSLGCTDVIDSGGKLVVYGVYSASARVSWPPSKIFGDEITILGSFSETYMFRELAYYLTNIF